MSDLITLAKVDLSFCRQHQFVDDKLLGEVTAYTCSQPVGAVGFASYGHIVHVGAGLVPLSVKEEYRNKGVGFEMMRATVDYLDEIATGTSLSIMRALVLADNTHARRVFDRLNFMPVSIQRDQFVEYVRKI